MQRQQRLLKLCILLLMPVGVIAAMGALAGTFWFYASGVRYLSSANAPSGHFRAIIFKSRDQNECGESARTDITFVVVERHTWFVKTGEFTPFCVFAEAASGLSIHWSGPNELSIVCPNCTEENSTFYDGNWGQAAFRLTTAIGAPP